MSVLSLESSTTLREFLESFAPTTWFIGLGGTALFSFWRGTATSSSVKSEPRRLTDDPCLRAPVAKPEGYTGGIAGRRSHGLVRCTICRWHQLVAEQGRALPPTQCRRRRPGSSRVHHCRRLEWALPEAPNSRPRSCSTGQDPDRHHHEYVVHTRQGYFPACRTPKQQQSQPCARQRVATFLCVSTSPTARPQEVGGSPAECSYTHTAWWRRRHSVRVRHEHRRVQHCSDAHMPQIPTVLHGGCYGTPLLQCQRRDYQQ